YEEGYKWQPEGSCSRCTCVNGETVCTHTHCATPVCLHPTKTTERFYHPTDSCQSCGCTNGTVRCQRKPCPFAACSHPIVQECCRTCEGCLYEGRERAHGERWDDSSDPCAACVCREGSVRCERKRCPSSNCKHPVQRQCCMSCDGCMFQGKEYADGTEFADDNGPCGVCYCYGGEVVCTKIPCHGECSHPYKPPGQCCGECERVSAVTFLCPCIYLEPLSNCTAALIGNEVLATDDPCFTCHCKVQEHDLPSLTDEV
uniref:VWFC domain-containing protein n=1 Tax=Mola mola TaxID=94237 RepID=A0A3Q3WF54_MOLML